MRKEWRKEGDKKGVKGSELTPIHAAKNSLRNQQLLTAVQSITLIGGSSSRNERGVGVGEGGRSYKPAAPTRTTEQKTTGCVYLFSVLFYFKVTSLNFASLNYDGSDTRWIKKWKNPLFPSFLWGTTTWTLRDPRCAHGNKHRPRSSSPPWLWPPCSPCSQHNVRSVGVMRCHGFLSPFRVNNYKWRKTKVKKDKIKAATFWSQL